MLDIRQRPVRRLGPLALAGLLLGSPAICRAQDSTPVTDPGEPLLESGTVARPPASGGGFGEIGIALGLGAALPLGGLEGTLDQRDPMGPGLNISVDLGFGINQYVAVGPWFQFQSLAAARDCEDCSGSSRGIGGMLVIRPLSGSYWDLWGGAGMGYRATSTSLNAVEERTYRGFEWVHAQLGVDWFPNGSVGYGPVAGVDVGSFADESGRDIQDRRVHWLLTFGLRLVYKTEPFLAE